MPTAAGGGRDGSETSLEQSGISREEIHCLQALVLRYRDAFALNPSELGRISVLHHKIQTRDPGPVAQAARRMLWNSRETARELVDNMKRQRLVEDSTGPWSSPIVLVERQLI